MSILEKKYLSKIMAVIVIILLILSDCLFVGKSIVSYALDVVNTNNENVEFMAYFLNEEGEKIQSLEQNIDKETKLRVDVAVKQEGYFNGKIVLEDSNFKFKLGQENEYISQVTEDTITLNQINAESTLSLDLVIEPKVSDKVNLNFFRCETKVLLQGSYINSKNVESNNFTEISGMDKVEVKWESSENTNDQLDSKILTNFIYNENEEEKRIVQVLINSNITANNFPVKNNNIAIRVPENATGLKVHARSTDATNSNINFDQNNYQYDEQKKILKIELQNTDSNEICWNKNTKDTVIVTLTFSKDENLQGKEIVVGNLINTYDDKNITSIQNLVITEDVDGIVSSTIESKDEIYKGKIYTGEERDYSSKTTVNVDYLNVLDKMEIIQKESTFVKDEEELGANIVYKSTKIDKNEFLKLFGEDGFVTIKDDNATVVADINKNSETDENGKIVVNYLNQPKSLEILTSKPVALGRLNIENTKAILASGYERTTIDGITAIKEKVVTNQKDQDSVVVLKDTDSQAEIKVNPNVIIASDEVEQIEIEATLLANDETKDLYKNPVVTFVLPKELEIQSAKCRALYRNGLEVDEEGVTTGKNEEGESIIRIKFAGEQTSYEYTGGTKIYVRADAKTNKEIETTETAIKMIYTNENKNQTKEVEAGLILEAAPVINNRGVLLNNEEIPEIPNRNLTMSTQTRNAGITSNNTEDHINVAIRAIAGNRELTENEDIYEGQTVFYLVTVTNNTGRDYSNVQIKANQKNGYVWDLYEEQMINHAISEDVVTEHFYETKETNEISLVKLDSLRNGESYTYSYDASAYLLNNENIEGNQTYGTISIVSEDDDLNETKESIKNTIRSAELKVEVLEGASRERDWYSEKSVETEIDVENLTSDVKENVKLKIILVKNANLGNEESIKDMFVFGGISDRVTIEGITVNPDGHSMVTLNLSSIEANEKITIGMSPYTNEIQSPKDSIEMCAQAETEAGTIYKSNNLIRTIINSAHNYEIKQKVQYSNDTEVNYASDKVENGEILKITGTVVNNEEKPLHSSVRYILDNALEIQSATLNVGGNEREITQEFNSNSYNNDSLNIEAKGVAKIVIIAKLNTDKTTEDYVKCLLDITNLEKIKNKTNTLTISVDKKEATTNETPKEEPGNVVEESEEGGIKIIKTQRTVEDDQGSEDEDNNPTENKPGEKDDKPGPKEENNNKEDSSNTEDSQNKATYKISGTAWVDKNKDGRKVASEEKVSGMTVSAIDAFSGTQIATGKTGANGEYTLNVPQGNYIVLFYYNDEIYKLTTYQAEGVSNNENSNAISKTFIINNKSVLVGATDSLKVTSNLTDINIGLVNRNKFELKIDKYISKVVVSNSAGSKTYDQKDKTSLAKVEIKAKNLQNSLVVIEYKIKVTNTGDVEGYAQNIVDYLPSGLNFNSTMNSNWYKSGNYVYNSSLANTKIKPGETKELTLVATKTMTENNTGLINNTAEIKSATNSLGLENEANNKAQADIIISVSTGAFVSYVSCTIGIFGMTVLIAYLLNKKKTI